MPCHLQAGRKASRLRSQLSRRSFLPVLREAVCKAHLLHHSQLRPQIVGAPLFVAFSSSADPSSLAFLQSLQYPGFSLHGQLLCMCRVWFHVGARIVQGRNGGKNFFEVSYLRWLVDKILLAAAPNKTL